MRNIPAFNFHKNKYGDELLIDVVGLNQVKKFLRGGSTHTLTYYDITFITQGSGYFTIDDKQYIVSPGDVVFSLPGEIRSWDIEGIADGYALIFEEEFLTSFFNDTDFVRQLAYFNPGRTPACMALESGLYAKSISVITDINTEINISLQKDNHLLRALLYEILMLLNRQYRQVVQPSPHTFQSSALYLKDFIDLVSEECTRHHDVAYYAGKLCITAGYLNEIVRAKMNVSAKHYITSRILSEARRMLTYSTLSISQISDELHFGSQSYFIRFFRKHTGVTPLQYRTKTF